MYQKLYSTIAAFSILFILVSFLMSLSTFSCLFFSVFRHSLCQSPQEPSAFLGSGSGCNRCLFLDSHSQWPCSYFRQVSWEILNFAALAAVCIICSPSGRPHPPTFALLQPSDLPFLDNSRLLSYVSQLPTEDPDDDEDGGQGVELGGVASYAQDFDSDSGEDTKPVTTQPKAQTQAAGTKTSSPSRSSVSLPFSAPLSSP
jgi:hypothetical protein